MAIRLGELLVQAGLITEDQLSHALRNQSMFSGKLGTNLVELGYITEATLAEFLGKQLKIPCITGVEMENIPPEVLKAISSEIAQQSHIVPISLEGKNLKVAMADPTDIQTIDTLRYMTGFKIQPVVAPEVLIFYALEKYYGMKSQRRYLRITALTADELQIAREQQDRMRTQSVEEKISRELRGPVLDKEDLAHERVDNLDLEKASKRLAAVQNLDDVIQILIDTLGDEFRKIALFVTRQSHFEGWNHKGCEIKRTDLQNLHVPSNLPSVFMDVVNKKAPVRGGTERTEVDKWFLGCLGIPPGEPLIVFPIIYHEQVVTFIICSPFLQAHASIIEQVNALTRKAGHALQIIYLRKLILQS